MSYPATFGLMPNELRSMETLLQTKTVSKLITFSPLLRLAGVMAELIKENEPTPLRKFLLNVQWGIRYIIRATPLLCAQKR